MTAARDGRTRRGAVVYNPTKLDVEELRREIDAAAEAAGWGETLWFETSVEDTGAGPAREAVAQGADVVVAAGGDGTVRAVAEGLRDSGVPLALLPQGTGNLLARNLGLGVADLATSAKTVFNGEDRAIDLGVISLERADGTVDEHVFLVLAGMGLDAKMIASTDAKLKRRVGWLAYVDGGLRALTRIRPIKLRYSLDENPVRAVSAHSIMIGNCGQLPGGILLIPDARLDDGVLDIVLLRPHGPLGWIQVWRKIGFENGVLRKSAAGRKIIDLVNDTRSVDYRTGMKVRADSDEAEEVQLDGDEFGEAIGFTAVVDPGALLVRVDPRAPTAEGTPALGEPTPEQEVERTEAEREDPDGTRAAKAKGRRARRGRGKGASRTPLSGE